MLKMYIENLKIQFFCKVARSHNVSYKIKDFMKIWIDLLVFLELFCPVRFVTISSDDFDCK